MNTILIHIANEEPIFGEVDQLPAPTDVMLTVKNPRKRDGKDLPYLAHNVTQVIWPLSRIGFIEIMPSDEEEEIIGFVREQ
jgi:hypothetical protein